MNRTYFLSGIDTDAGKTYATAFLARRFMSEGYTVATQKFVQTGCVGSSEDIEAHRRLMGIAPLPEDLDLTTAPQIFTHPCSPQLAARLDGRNINIEAIDRSRRVLAERYDVLIIEGAGGLMVPLTDNYFTIDYPAQHHLPLVLVTNSRLGSINHTILALEAIEHRHCELAYVIFNHHFDYDPEITADTLGFISRYLAKHFPDTDLLEMP